MKFAHKLFFAMTALLTLIFTIFGIWMLSSYFQKLLDRETEQGKLENQMFQYLFEMAYQSMQEYGDQYAIHHAINSVVENVEKDNSLYFVIAENRDFYYGADSVQEENYQENIAEVIENLNDSETRAYRIRQIEDRYFLISICISEIAEERLYLGLSKDITNIYDDRQNLLNQYRFVLVVLLIAGGICIYVITQRITSPIRKLGRVARLIANGDFEKRSEYAVHDEIGELADSFNRMADRLVEQMSELEQEARRKEMEARQKEEFTASFAHELKTPLTSIIGYADMLNSIELSEQERREAYFYIFSQGKRLESLSHKLLELAGMEKNPIDIKPISTRKLEENLRKTMRPIFRQKQIKGKITMEKGILQGDFELLLSLFYNLLDNAVKAVEAQGFILLKGTCLTDGYEVKVVDNGRGIPEHEISRVTEAFYMVDKSRSRKEGGAGIGMALCQKIILLHGGTLQIESKEGEGTVIRLFFPEKQLKTEQTNVKSAAV